jgi:hypothetical protein
VNQKDGWVVDVRRGVLQATKVAVAIVRPKFPRWGFEITVEVNEDLVNVEKIMDLFEIAGRQCGLGDFRPGTKGQFGRFSVKEFAALEAAKPTTRRKAA